MVLTNGKKFFKVLLILLTLTGCNQNDSKPTIFFKVKKTKNYSSKWYGNNDEGFELEDARSEFIDALNGKYLLNQGYGIEMDFSELTFYNSKGELINYATFEDCFGDFFSNVYDTLFFNAQIKHGKIDGKLRIYDKTVDDKGSFGIENLQLLSEYNYSGGKNHGPYFEYIDGVLTKKGKFYFGQKIGSEIEYFETGEIRGIAKYESNHKVGEAKVFHRNGTINSLKVYNNKGEQVKSKRYNEAGLLVEEIEFSNEERKFRVYDFETKVYRTYTMPEFLEEPYSGSFYSSFTDDGTLKFCIDFSHLNKNELIVRFKDLKVNYFINENKANFELKSEDTTLLFSLPSVSFQRFVDNKLTGEYNTKTKSVQGEIDFITLEEFTKKEAEIIRNIKDVKEKFEYLLNDDTNSKKDIVTSIYHFEKSFFEAILSVLSAQKGYTYEYFEYINEILNRQY